VRITVALLVCAALAACNDVRDFSGGWQGARVGDAPELKVGVVILSTGHDFTSGLSVVASRILVALDPRAVPLP